MNLRRRFNSFYSCRSKDNLSIREVLQALKTVPNVMLVDVRSEQEYKEYHLPRSTNIPLYELERVSERILPNKESVIILYCQKGTRSKQAAELLKKRGYKNIYNLEGGLDGI